MCCRGPCECGQVIVVAGDRPGRHEWGWVAAAEVVAVAVDAAVVDAAVEAVVDDETVDVVIVDVVAVVGQSARARCGSSAS